MKYDSECIGVSHYLMKKTGIGKKVEFFFNFMSGLHNQTFMV